MRRSLRLASLSTFVVSAIALGLAACASSTPGAPLDAEPVGPADAAIPPDAGPPDAEPCIPDPDGETCNGNNDDCDEFTDEGFPGVGEACSVGVGECAVDGLTQCTTDGSSTECGATEGTPGEELCGTTLDEDCDGNTDEGFPNLGTPCSVGTGACFAAGVYVCSATGLTTTCNATPGDPMPETCNGQDEDCDILVDEGFNVNQPCDDGSDSDLCAEGIYACDGAGGVMCTDATGSTFDVCNGGDDDCDPTSADGSEDGTVGVACDGAGDTDLCPDVLTTCAAGGSVVCIDNTTSTVDLCGNGNEDCDPASADGSEEPGYNATCDGAGDTDLCAEGNMNVCSGTTLTCSDATGSTLDTCGGGDQDCDPASVDGSEQAGYNATCDGAGDSDLCAEGNMTICSGTTLVCDDVSSSTLDTCGGGDQDCDPGSADGSEQGGYNAPCDGSGDSDLCIEGNMTVCSGTTLVCSDVTGSTLDACGNGDDDCDGASGDGTEHAGYNAPCDGGGDSDLCVEGNMNVCSGTSLTCSDATGSTFEACNGDAVDEDCEGGVDEGFVLNDNPACSPPFYVGQINGDNGSPVLTDSWFDEEWDRIRLHEDDNGIVYLSGHFQLYSPPGVDFDLYLYCNGCTGSAIQSSTTHSLAGHYDTVDIRNDDDWGSDDDFDAIVEIRYYQSNRCANWTLTVTGDLFAPTNNCDP